MGGILFAMLSPLLLCRKYRPGFSTIEMMIVIGIFVIASVATLPLLSLFNERQTIASLSTELLQTLRRAQSRSLAGTLGEQWGIFVEGDKYTMYAGTSFVSSQNQEEHTISKPFKLCTNADNPAGDILFPQVPVQANTSYFIRLYADETDGAKRLLLIDTNGSIRIDEDDPSLICSYP